MHRLILILIGFALVASAGMYGMHLYTESLKPDGEMELLLVEAPRRPATGCTFEYDVAKTHCLLLVSEEVVRDAVTKSQLGQLPSMHGRDAVTLIEKSLRAERVGTSDLPILRVTINGIPSREAVPILEALIEAHQRYIDSVYNEVLNKAKDDLNRLAPTIAQAFHLQERLKVYVITRPRVGK